MKKTLLTAYLLIATCFSAFAMLSINSLTVNASSDINVFLEEVRKPDGSGYIFDGEDGINISTESVKS